jgi:Abortive infection C-terminus
MDPRTGLTGKDIHIIVNKFVGAPGGWLNGFSDRTLNEFLLYEMSVPSEHLGKGTKRERLLNALHKSASAMQRKILTAIIERFPPDATATGVAPERELVRQDVERLLVKLEPTSPVDIPHSIHSSELVKEALQSARTLMIEHGPAHAIDRIHTAIHAYLREKCGECSTPFRSDDQITRLYKLLREHHPRLNASSGWEAEVDRVMHTQATVLEQLNNARNRDSLAHPNALIPDPEANLFIDAATTFFRYLEAKLA